jgi:hypothetical protein
MEMRPEHARRRYVEGCQGPKPRPWQSGIGARQEKQKLGTVNLQSESEIRAGNQRSTICNNWIKWPKISVIPKASMSFSDYLLAEGIHKCQQIAGSPKIRYAFLQVTKEDVVC